MLELILTKSAETDLEEIAAYTATNFGEAALDRYLRLFETAFINLRTDPNRIGVRVAFGELKKYHLSYCKEAAKTDSVVVKEPRHLVFFRASSERVEVIRVLHESMDSERHLPE